MYAQLNYKDNITYLSNSTLWKTDRLNKVHIYYNFDSLHSRISVPYIDSILFQIKEKSGIYPGSTYHLFIYDNFQSFLSSNIAIEKLVSTQSSPLIYNNKILMYAQDNRMANSDAVVNALIASTLYKLSKIRDDQKLAFLKSVTREVINPNSATAAAKVLITPEPAHNLYQINWDIFWKAIASSSLNSKTKFLLSNIRTSKSIPDVINTTYETTDSSILAVYNHYLDSIKNDTYDKYVMKIKITIPYLNNISNSHMNQSWSANEGAIFSLRQNASTVMQIGNRKQELTHSFLQYCKKQNDSILSYKFISDVEMSMYELDLAKKTFQKTSSSKLFRHKKNTAIDTNVTKYKTKLEAHSEYSLRFENLYNPNKHINSYLGNANNELLKGYYKKTFSDLFEDYKFGFEFSIPINFSGSGFTLFFDNYKRRLDWGGYINRNIEKVTRTNFDYWQEQFDGVYPDMIKVRNHIVQLHAKYPITYYTVLKLTIRAEQNKTFFPATTESNLNLPSFNQNYVSASMGYHYNNISYASSKYNPENGSNLIASLYMVRNLNTSKTANYFQLKYSKYWKLQPIGILNIALEAQKKLGKNNIIFNAYAAQNNIIPAIDTNFVINKDNTNVTQQVSNNFRGAIQNQIRSNQFLSATVNLESFQFDKITMLPVLRNIKIGIWNDNILSYNNNKASFHYAIGPSLSLHFANKNFKLYYCAYSSLKNKNIIYLSIFL